MLKYALLTVEDGEIYEPELFDTFERAHAEMCKQVADVMGITVEEVQKCYKEDRMIDDYSYVQEYYAFVDKHVTSDWRIFRLDI